MKIKVRGVEVEVDKKDLPDFLAALGASEDQAKDGKIKRISDIVKEEDDRTEDQKRMDAIMEALTRSGAVEWLRPYPYPFNPTTPYYTYGSPYDYLVGGTTADPKL